jgi:hypothetical protein
VRFVRNDVLQASPERVLAVLADWERQPLWMPDVAWMRLAGTGRELGARLEVRTRVFGIPAATDDMTVTVWDPPRRLAIEHEGVVKGIGEWLLAPIGARAPGGDAVNEGEGGARWTRFTWIESFRMPPPVAGDLALLIYSPWQRWMLRRSVRNLKQIIESDG